MMLITDHSELTSNKMSLISILLFSVCLMPVVSCWYRKWLPVHWPRICWDPLWETWCLPKHPQYHYMMHSYLWIILWCMFCVQDCYILDQGGSSVMVWKGKAASDEERHSAMSRAVVSNCVRIVFCKVVYLFNITSLLCHNRCTQIFIPQGFIKAKNYPSNTKVEVMSEGGESGMFKHLFKSWKEKGQTQGLGKTHSVGKIGDSSFSIISHVRV